MGIKNYNIPIILWKNWEYYRPPRKNVAFPQENAKVDATENILPPNGILMWTAFPSVKMCYACPTPNLAL